MTVKAIRHHQSFAGRDADDAHEQYLRIVDHEGGGSSVHNDLTGRDSATAHTQYLRLAEMNQQIVHNLKAYALEALNIVSTSISPPTISCENLYIQSSGGTCEDCDNGYNGGDIYIRTVVNSGDNCYGSIYITTDPCGESGNICLIGCCGTFDFCGLVEMSGCCFCGSFTEMVYLAGECIFLCADGKVCIEGDLCVDGDLYVYGNIAAGDAFIEAGALYLGTCGKNILCIHSQADSVAESECAMIGFCGCDCSAFAGCAAFWDGAITGENHAKYCLKGGIFIEVNGCQRYIKFHKALV